MTDIIWAAIINAMAVMVAAVVRGKNVAIIINAIKNKDGNIEKMLSGKYGPDFLKYLLRTQKFPMLLMMFNIYLIVVDFINPSLIIDVSFIYSIAIKVSTFFSLIIFMLIFYISRLTLQLMLPLRRF